MDSGLTRQEFLRQSGALVVLAGLLAIKPAVALTLSEKKSLPKARIEFSQPQQRLLDAVQMRLFPDDGDGPSARDLHALDYLQWALADPKNIADGDADFIEKGIGWLEEASQDSLGESFAALSSQQQDQLLRQVASSRAGENWLSLLLYYLIESLTLDPVYGGNPDGIGWRWLEHQPGFPRPTKHNTYHHFL